MNGLAHIRRMLGDEDHSRLTDADIKEALYHYYFDVEQATNWLLGKCACRSQFRIVMTFPQRNNNAGWRRKSGKVSFHEPCLFVIPSFRFFSFPLPSTLCYLVAVGIGWPCYWRPYGSEKVHILSYLKAVCKRCADRTRGHRRRLEPTRRRREAIAYATTGGLR